MKVYCKCNNCKEEYGFLAFTNTRVEFAMQYGDYKEFTCKHCATMNKRHVNDFYAKPSKIAFIVASLVFLVGTPLLFFVIIPAMASTSAHKVYFIGGIILLPVFIYGLMLKQDRNRVNSFNRHQLKERGQK